MNVQKKLSKAIQDFQSLELTKQHLALLEERLHDAYEKLEDLHDILKKEYKDVQVLEQLSMRKLFQTILGNQEKHLEKERQEYLEAALHYNEFNKTVELIEYEKKILDRKLENYNLVKSELNALIRQRERELLKTEGTARFQLSSINNVIDGNLRIKRELHEALAVGLKVKEVLAKMEEQLKNASNWGDWNYNQSTEKRDLSIEKATKLSYQAKELLIQFEKEIDDVFKKKKMSWSFDLKGSEKFNNLYFKNLISDWVIQRKILDTLHHTSKYVDKITRTNTSLKVELKQIAASIDYLEDKKRNLILEIN